MKYKFLKPTLTNPNLIYWLKRIIAGLIIPIFLIIIICLNLGAINNEVWSKTDTFTLDYTVKINKQAGEDFVILNLADMQIDLFTNLTFTKNQIAELIEYKQPNLITLTGDQNQGPGTKKLIELMTYIDSFNIPWAPIFGNHDSEFASRNRLADIYMSFENCIFKKGPNNLGNIFNPCIGNYVISIMEDDVLTTALIMMDSNSYTFGGYASLHTSQIEWYEWVISGLKTYNEDIETMAFFHIPLHEVKKAYNEGIIYPGTESTGVYKKDPFCHGVKNTGMFAKIKELKSTKFIFNGHDHINNFSLTYEGVTFTYCLKTGNNSYHTRTGGTFITITNSGTKLEHKILNGA